MKPNLIPYLFVFLLLTITIDITGQVSSRNGYWTSNTGTIRMFVVFAEAVGDPADTNSTNWLPGQMPTNPGYLLDHVLSANITGMVTKVYNQASFTNFTVLGDYYPNLVQLNYSAISGGGETQVLDYLNNLSGANITSAHGYTFNSGDFDMWVRPAAGSYGVLKSTGTDAYIDIIAIFWRVNSKLSSVNGSGYIYCSALTKTVKQKSGFQDLTNFTSFNGDNWDVLRHEFGHSLLGGNPMHTVGPVNGERAFISNPGGYSLLNYSGALGNLYNGYDRYRLGWKGTNTNYISARTQGNAEINGDMVYGQAFPGGSGTYILRDFVTTGDAIRIKLPYLKSESSTVYDQWLWLENHQMKSGKLDLNMTQAKGLYAYIQVGKDDLSNFLGLANYLYPLHAFGHYDFDVSQMKSTYDEVDIESELSKFGTLNDNVLSNIENVTVSSVDKLIVNSEKSNPFTGYNIIMGMAYDIINPNIINGVSYYDEIFRNETAFAHSIEKDGVMLGSSDYYYTDPDGNPWPCLGTLYDEFAPGRKISIGSNPSSTPVLTYRSPAANNSRPSSTPQNFDNRKIYLNGLSVEVVQQYSNGDIQINIKWNDFDVNSDVRWCGPIVLNEKVYVKTGKSVTLDQGLTPTKPVSPMTIDGSKIFADYTIFRCKNSSLFKLEENSSMTVKNKSALILESGSTYEINNGSELYIKAGSTLNVKSGANLVIKGTGSLIIESGGYVCFESGSTINLQDYMSLIYLRPGYIMGVNPNVISGSPSCISSPTSIVKTGNGSIIYGTSCPPVSSTSLTGPVTLCTSSQYSVSKPSGSTVIWSCSSNISKVSAQNSNPCTFQKSSNGNGWIQAEIVNACGDYKIISRTVHTGPYSSSDYPITGPTTVNCNSYANYSIPQLNDVTSINWTWPSGWTYLQGQNTRYLNLRSGTTGGAVCVGVNNICGQSGSYYCLYTSVYGSCGYGMILSPNPASTEISIELVDSTGAALMKELDFNYDIEIYNVSNFLVYRNNTKNKSMKIDIESLPIGWYIVRLIKHKEVLSEGKFLKE